MATRRERASERGVVLLQAVVFLSLLTTAVTVVATSFVARSRAARIQHARTLAFYAAEAGVARALADLAEHPAWAYEREETLGDATFAVVASRGAAGETAIRSVGRASGVTSVVTARAAGEGETLALVRWGGPEEAGLLVESTLQALGRRAP